MPEPRPVFADVDPRTYNLDPAAAEAAITPRTKAILVVHQIGLPADIDRFQSLAEKYGIKILEDAACAWAVGTAAGRSADTPRWRALAFIPAN